ncbi:hypothetical protein AGMMS49936_09980 [Endomicrobiia bacterium]|nr:hypothetical protein AGMMS49936_09980 [Endomicrobiia bacterium]
MYNPLFFNKNQVQHCYEILQKLDNCINTCAEYLHVISKVVDAKEQKEARNKKAKSWCS